MVSLSIPARTWLKCTVPGKYGCTSTTSTRLGSPRSRVSDHVARPGLKVHREMYVQGSEIMCLVLLLVDVLVFFLSVGCFIKSFPRALSNRRSTRDIWFSIVFRTPSLMHDSIAINSNEKNATQLYERQQSVDFLNRPSSRTLAHQSLLMCRFRESHTL